MSHDDSRRGACNIPISSGWIHSINCEKARDVTDVGVGSGALFGEELANQGSGIESMLLHSNA